MSYNKEIAERANKVCDSWPDWKRELAGLPPREYKKCSVVECNNITKHGFCPICLVARENFKRKE